MPHKSLEQLQAGLDDLCESPSDVGTLELIVRRPQPGIREVVEDAILDRRDGLVGDSWLSRGSSATADGAAHPEMQIALMNSRAIAVIAGDRQYWPSAGDQLFVDLDLSEENLPAGSRLAVGAAVIEITEIPHTACRKFAERFGAAAVRWAQSDVGRRLRLRGANARVFQSGRIRCGDSIRKFSAQHVGR